MQVSDNIISQNDAMLMLDICNRAISIRHKDELKQLMLDLEQLFIFDYSYCFGVNLNELINLEKKPNIEYLDVNYPKGLLGAYLKQSMHLDDPVAEEYIKSFKVQNWQDCFEKNDNKGLMPVLQDGGIIDGYAWDCQSAIQYSNSFLFCLQI